MIAFPHFLLYAESGRQPLRGDWRFVIESIDGAACIEAADFEPELTGERLELLTVVRGLEALDEPARVTLLTPSRYVTRGLTFGLDDWRSNGWTWEAFGRLAPVKNSDLWQRIDHARQFHQVECRQWRFDEAHLAVGGDEAAPVGSLAEAVERSNASWSNRGLRRALLQYRRRTAERLDAMRLGLAQLGAGLAPSPWLG